MPDFYLSMCHNLLCKILHGNTDEKQHIFSQLACDEAHVCSVSGYLAAGELAEVRFEVLSDHCVNGHQAEHTGFPHTALRVVITLFNQIK